MTGFNLPPGVSVNMIPGNRPEDLADEAFWEKLYELAHKESGNHTELDNMMDNDTVQLLVQKARELGYIEGTNDEKMNQDLEKAMAQDEQLG